MMDRMKSFWIYGPLLVSQGQLGLHRLENTLINIPIGVRRFFNLDEPREASTVVEQKASLEPGNNPEI